MAGNYIENIKVENGRIIYRNFRGEEGAYNREGDRSFSLVIEDENFAKEKIAEGWNLKQLKSMDPEDAPVYHLPVKVRFNNIPPKVWLITDKGTPDGRMVKKRTLLNEDTIGQLDYAEIERVHVEVTPYEYKVRGSSGISAYLKTMYVEIKPDPFAYMYAGLDDENAEDVFADMNNR